MIDESEAFRRSIIDMRVDQGPFDREMLAARYNSEVYDTDELMEQFEVISYLAPFVMVRRRSDGVKGSLEFQHRPRFYFSFSPE